MIEGLVLRDPLWLVLLAALPWLAWRHHRGGGFPALTYSRLPAAAGGLWRLHLPWYCRWLALALVIVALARPQIGNAVERRHTEGIDIQIVLDVSGSMAAEDFQPDRLGVAKEVVHRFVDRRRADRLGLVTFAGGAVTRAPLTADHRSLRRLVSEVDLGELPEGTAIGVALTLAARRLQHSEARSKVAVLVTDGANNAGEIAPRTAAEVCRQLGIRIYTIGVGTDEPVAIPRTYVNPRTGQKQEERRYLRIEMDEELLRDLAAETGGRFFRATDSAGLEESFREIDRLETTVLEVERRMLYRELFPPLVSWAVTLLLLPLVPAAVGWTVEP